jgi:hypothetical protein
MPQDSHSYVVLLISSKYPLSEPIDLQKELDMKFVLNFLTLNQAPRSFLENAVANLITR